MKPGDHPEFFRLPPPEGRSRESSIVLTKDGRFFHDGSAVEHPGMHKAFASWLRRHPDDGRYVLSNGYDWTYLTVEGPAQFVSAVRSVDGRPELTLLDGRELPLDPSALTSDSDGRLWLALPEGDAACFTGAAQLQLEPWLSERSGGFGLEIDGRFWPIAG
ncbi:MAG TPA: hypothetical protein VEQ59_11185 [Polyangiaceae bacterium]|nr:hypothetical protein [Polyangiaceae bacterium]